MKIKERIKKTQKRFSGLMKEIFKPEWKRLAILLILFLILPQRVYGRITLFGGVYLVKYIVETYQPILDAVTLAILMSLSYVAVSLVVWMHERKQNMPTEVAEQEEPIQKPQEKKEEEKKE